MIRITFIECFLCARHITKLYTNIPSLNPGNSTVKKALLSYFTDEDAESELLSEDQGQGHKYGKSHNRVGI